MAAVLDETALQKINRLKQEYAGFPVIEEGVTHQQFRERARRRGWPEGSEYVAALATVFGSPTADIARSKANLGEPEETESP